jgi:hypothetical protein
MLHQDGPQQSLARDVVCNSGFHDHCGRCCSFHGFLILWQLENLGSVIIIKKSAEDGYHDSGGGTDRGVIL